MCTWRQRQFLHGHVHREDPRPEQDSTVLPPSDVSERTWAIRRTARVGAGGFANFALALHPSNLFIRFEAKAGVSLLRQIPNNTAHLWWDHTWGSMLNSLDKGIGNVTAALRAENMWDSTVLLLTADNGGDCGFSAFLEPAVENNLANRARANNYPLRGRKCTPW